MDSSASAEAQSPTGSNRFPLHLWNSPAAPERRLFYVLAATALIYAFAAGLKTIAEFDLGWLMATGRWIVRHHQIPSMDVFSYTAAGRPWSYPLGAGLLYYGAFLLGGYALISWLAAAGCVGTVALLLRRGSCVTAALSILAVPVIALRANARAELFTIVLFAASLSLLWQQQESGDARLWLLPLLMGAWVNLHPGFVAGLVLLGAYAIVEALKMFWPKQRSAASRRLRRCSPWLLAVCCATLLNPWGGKIYQVVWRQGAAMQTQSQSILEWAPIRINWMHVRSVLLLRESEGIYLLLLIGAAAVVVGLLSRQLGAALLVAGSAMVAMQHNRFTALFAIVLVIVGGDILDSAFHVLARRIDRKRLTWGFAVAASAIVVGLGAIRVTNLITDRTYLSGTNLDSFGAGLSWWFPEDAAKFIERERLPGQIFNTYNEGGYFVWRLGLDYRDYIDGRAIPFGPELLERNGELLAALPDSSAWRYEAGRYDINVLLIPIGRFLALQFFPVLRQFCESDSWRPVYLDEVSVVFLRRRPETEELIQRLQINCSTAALPRDLPSGTGTAAFNHWANAASVLHALGRDSEALAATGKALAIFAASGYIHWTRAHLFEEAGNQRQAEQEYLLATQLEPDSAASWSALAAFYQSQGRWPEAIQAWENAVSFSNWPWEQLISLGYADLLAHRPKEALAAFDDAAGSLPAHAELIASGSLLANIAHGRARAWYYLGNLNRAIEFEEEAARLLPGNADLLRQLAALYDLAGRSEDANKIRARLPQTSQP